MSIELEGLTEFQKDLLQVAQVKLPRETFKMMRKAGNKLNIEAKKEARKAVSSDTGNYMKGFRRGKVFRDANGQVVVRAINSSPHAHLLEYGHRIVRGGKTVGFAPGRLIVSAAAKNYQRSGSFEKIIVSELDRMLRDHGL